MGDLPGELLAAPLVDQAEVGRCVTGPGAGLRLSVTLEEEANTLGVPILKEIIQINMQDVYLTKFIPVL